MEFRRAFALFVLLLAACGGNPAPADPEPPVSEPEGSVEPPPDPAPPSRRISIFEVDPPYFTDPGFWDRPDLFVLSPDHEPLDAWPDEVLDPARHGLRIIVLLPGDYTGRSNGSLPPGVLYIPASGTAAEPLLVTYAPSVGADMSAVPHPAERFGQDEARLLSVRIWNQDHQYFRGLTFADGVSACVMWTTQHSVFDACLWHETGPQPIRIRFDAQHNLVQRCVMRRFDVPLWGHNDTVAIQASDGACTHNRIVSNVILNYTDSYQHTDRDGEDYGLGAGTIIDNNFMGFTQEAYVSEPEGELMCGENTLDFKMGGTEAEPVRVTDNVFFGVRAAKAGCAASGSGGYAVTMHRRGTWVELTDNLFVDCDAGIFLNSFFLDLDPALGRIDPRLTIERNLFSGIRSRATAFPTRTGHVLTGLSPALFSGNTIVDCDRLMEREPLAPHELVIEDNAFYGALVLDPRDQNELESDSNAFFAAALTEDTVLHVPWVGRTLSYWAPR